MATTPPPRSRRVHTPPAPRFGNGDDWSPFTPRRSSRVAAQRIRTDQLQTPDQRFPVPPNLLTVSPPASPLSPTHNSRQSTKQTTKSSRKQKNRPHATSDSDTEIEQSRLPKTSLLPTPSKTPRKKHMFRDQSTASTVLFHSRLANIEDAMPTPKKIRQRQRAYSLDPSIHVQDDRIEVYEDSKERIPTANYDEDNPFLSKPSAQSTFRTKSKARSKSDVETVIKNDEGIVYVFRGKRILRKFDEDHDDDDNLSDHDIRRRAGKVNTPRPVRTSLEPRILFPTEDQLRAKEAAAEEADEEALTDIEVPCPGNKPKAVSKGTKQTPESSKASAQSVPQIFIDQDITQEETSNGASERVTANNGPPSPRIVNKRLAGTKRGRPPSPFDAWSRTKPIAASPIAKRHGSPLEKPPGKRVRASSITTSL